MPLHHVNVMLVGPVITSAAFVSYFLCVTTPCHWSSFYVLRYFCGIFVSFDIAELFKLILVPLNDSCHLITDKIERRKIVICVN